MSLLAALERPGGPAERQAEGAEAPHSGALKPQGLRGVPTWTSAFWVRILPAPSQASLGKPFSTRSPEDWGAATIYLLSGFTPAAWEQRPSRGSGAPGRQCQPPAGLQAAEHTSVSLWLRGDAQMLGAAPPEGGKARDALSKQQSPLYTRLFLPGFRRHRLSPARSWAGVPAFPSQVTRLRQPVAEIIITER